MQNEAFVFRTAKRFDPTKGLQVVVLHPHPTELYQIPLSTPFDCQTCAHQNSKCTKSEGAIKSDTVSLNLAHWWQLDPNLWISDPLPHCLNWALNPPSKFLIYPSKHRETIYIASFDKPEKRHKQLGLLFLSLLPPLCQ